MNVIASGLRTPIVLLTWGVVLGYFCITNRIASYLHPSFHALTWVSAAVLILLAVATALLPEKSCTHDDCHHHHGGGWLSTLVLIVPLIAATTLSPSEFGIAAVQNRGTVQDMSQLPAFVPRADDGRAKIQLVDLLYATAEPSMREDFENRNIEIVGQFLPARTGNPDGDRFEIVRMFVMCCAADARPVSVAVQSDRPADFPAMTWLKVTGRATFPFENGRRTALVVADSVTEVEAPAETFIY
jgi:uncharacterized repeat protein (TIGR03943 family)